MALTLQKVKRLFQGYPNFDLKVADEVATKIFDASTPSDVTAQINAAITAQAVKLTGTGSNFVTGPIKVKPGGAMDFWNLAGTQQKVGITYNADVLYFLGINVANDQNIRMTNFLEINIEPLNLKLGMAGEKVAFFGAAPVVRQTVTADVMTAPVDLPTALAEIAILQGIVGNLRTGLANSRLNLFQQV